MAPLATVTLTWAAVYAYVCAYYCMLYGRRRVDREYLHFGLLAGAMAVHGFANAELIDATTRHSAALALNVSAVGLCAAVPFFVEFCHSLVQRTNPMSSAVYAWAALGMGLAATGLYVDPVGPIIEPLVRFSWEAPVSRVGVTLLGSAHIGMGMLWCAWALFRLMPAARAQLELRLVFVTTGVTVVAGVHDMLLRIGAIRSIYSMEHVGLTLVLAMSYGLLERFVRTGEELRLRTGELETSHDTLRETQEKLVLKEQLAAVGELSAVIAHEVRNPLAIIKNAVSGLRRPTLSSVDRLTLLDILDEETDRLNRLMHDLLAYARPVEPKGRRLLTLELLEQTIARAMSGHPNSSRVQVSMPVGESPEFLYGDPDLLGHALVNIIDNALHAMPAGGVLKVRAEPARLATQEAVALVFEDEGEGMDTLVRSKARDPFFTTRPSGTGLGLAIVERVIRNHGGEVSIDSHHGRGTVVTVTLPRERPSLLPITVPDESDGLLSGIQVFER